MKLNMMMKAGMRTLSRTESSGSSDVPTTPQILDHARQPAFAAVMAHRSSMEEILESPGFSHTAQAPGSRLDAQPRDALQAAAETASLAEMRALLEQPGSDPNARDGQGFTALHIAAFSGNLGAVEALIEDPRTDCRARSIQGASALDCAAMGGHVPVMRMLIEQGGVSAMGETGKLRAIHLAAGRGHRDACECLLDHGERVDALGPQLSKPLHFAAANGHVEVMRLLLDRGAFAGAMNRKQKTPLHNAVAGGHGGAIRLLMAHGARADVPTDDLPAPIDCTSDPALRALMEDEELVMLARLHDRQRDTPDPRRVEAIRLLQSLALETAGSEGMLTPPARLSAAFSNAPQAPRR